MASLGQIIFSSMVVLIVIFSAAIILILVAALSGPLYEVMSTNTSPVANLGEDYLFICYLNKEDTLNRLTRVSVTWKKKDLEGVVYKYHDGAESLKEQNPEFRGRTQMFHNEFPEGNFSLLLRGVGQSDAGVYTCTVGSSGGGGSIKIDLRTAAFTAPTFEFSDGVLAAAASRWLPKPTVMWTSHDGHILKGNTSFKQNAVGIFSVASTLTPVNTSEKYFYSIENELVKAITTATIKDSVVSGHTYFTFDAASSLLPSVYLSIMTTVFCICYLI